jgi:hypothetical protein
LKKRFDFGVEPLIAMVTDIFEVFQPQKSTNFILISANCHPAQQQNPLYFPGLYILILKVSDFISEFGGTHS